MFVAMSAGSFGYARIIHCSVGQVHDLRWLHTRRWRPRSYFEGLVAKEEASIRGGTDEAVAEGGLSRRPVPSLGLTDAHLTHEESRDVR